MLLPNPRSCVILLSTCFASAFGMNGGALANSYCYGPAPCTPSVGGSHSYPYTLDRWNGKPGAGTVAIDGVNPARLTGRDDHREGQSKVIVKHSAERKKLSDILE